MVVLWRPPKRGFALLAPRDDPVARRINEIVPGKRTVTADTDLRLARYFELSEGFFPRLQADHDLMARRRGD